MRRDTEVSTRWSTARMKLPPRQERPLPSESSGCLAQHAAIRMKSRVETDDQQVGIKSETPPGSDNAFHSRR